MLVMPLGLDLHFFLAKFSLGPDYLNPLILFVFFSAFQGYPWMF